MPKQVVAKISRHLMYQEVSERIRQLIRERGLWGRYLAPERDLAGLFGVSRETIRRSLDLLQRAGVVARRHGQGTLVLPRRRSRGTRPDARILVASYHLGDGGSYTSDILSGLTAEAGEARWALSFSNLAIPAARREVCSDLRRGSLDGLLLMSVTDLQLVGELLACWSGPAVLVDHHFANLPLTGVIDDSEGGARQAVEHLLSLGHRRIGYVEISHRERNPWRYAGYAGALRKAGLELDESLIVKSFGSFESGLSAGDELLGRRDPPTAVFAFDDTRAWGVWRAAEARGLEVGRDFALVGFGDTAARAGFPEELSSVRFGSGDMGRLAVSQLRALISGRGEPGEVVLVPTELVIRKSSQNARPARACLGRTGAP